jgi:competence protein ComEC
VYKVAGQSAFDIISGGNSFAFIDSALLENAERMRFHIRPNRLQHGVRMQQLSPGGIVRELSGCRVIAFNGYKILHFYHKQHAFPEFINVDCLVVSRNAIGTITSLSTLKYKTLILDSSNSIYISEKIMNEAKATTASVYSVMHEGAFVATL